MIFLQVMKKRKVFAYISFTLMLAAVLFTIPLSTRAQSALGFGGFVGYTFPCTCSANFWLEMSPFYGPSPSPVGALVYTPGTTIVYAHGMIPAIGVWLLGDYIPGVQACYITIPYGCMVIPSLGVMRQVGTSM